MSEIKPQPGPQTQFLATSADIAFTGGAAGGGKTYSLIMEPLRHIAAVRGFGAVIFRRITTQITGEGGLWDETYNLYPHVDGRDRISLLDWHFPPHNNSIKFAHMEHEKNVYDWKGALIPLTGFDQLEDFTRKMFLYMLSRSRTACGIRPYMRCSYNPMPADDPVGGWLHEFVGWYLDENGEYPDPTKSGVIRWFVNLEDKLYWFDSREAAVTQFPKIPPKSFTFIPSSVYDNKILMQRDPDYLANLFALDHIDQERLLKSNHKIRPEAGKVFNKSWFKVVDAPPAEFDSLVRFWDFAATKRKMDTGAATAGVLMGTVGAWIYVLDVVQEWLGTAEIDEMLVNTAARDGYHVKVRWEEEGGASGKRDSWHIVSKLPRFDAAGVRPQGDKLMRSKGLAAQARVGNVIILRREWTERFLNHMHAVPDGPTMDVHDAAAGGYNEMTELVPVQAVVSEQEPVEISPY